MKYEKKLHIVNIVFTIVILLTLLVMVGLFIYGCFSQPIESNPIEDDKLSYAFRYIGIVAFIIMQFPVFIAEADLFFNARYFISPKDYKDRFKTVLNCMFSIFSIASIVSLIILLAAGIDFEDILFYWLVGFLCYIILRIIYLVYALVKNRREDKYYSKI